MFKSLPVTLKVMRHNARPLRCECVMNTHAPNANMSLGGGPLCSHIHRPLNVYFYIVKYMLGMVGAHTGNVPWGSYDTSNLELLYDR